MIREVDLRDFGARGDGTYDDRASVQAAIDYLAAHGGGILYGEAWIKADEEAEDK